jgi:hypothetical protein
MQHTNRAGGLKCMEVDHFNPRRKRDAYQKYDYLFLATRHCNGAKRDRWENNNHRKLGARFLNCCEEADYDVHILEDPDTHEVIGVSREGIYHVRNCDLNAPHLVQERRQRAKLWDLIEKTPVRLRDFGGRTTVNVQSVMELTEALRKVASEMIPKIEYLSGVALKNYISRKQRLADLELKQ